MWIHHHNPDTSPGIEARAHEDQFCELFSLTMTQIKTMLPLTTNLKDAYKTGRDDEQNFIQNMALFISTILKEHGYVSFAVVVWELG